MTDSPDAVIRMEGLCMRYGRRFVLDGVDAEIPRGAIYGLLGPNGAGKTTLLRLVMGLIAPTAGRITLFGHLPPGHREARRQVGYMPQAQALYPALTARENVAFFGHLYGVGGEELSRRTEELLELVDLRAHADKPVEALSGGMARRAMLATTMVQKPRLLILDEPTAGVDPALRVRFWDWFEELVSEGTTILITTHHIAEAARARRVLFLREGKILDDGTPAELMRRYAAEDLEEAFVHATAAGEERAGA